MKLFKTDISAPYFHGKIEDKSYPKWKTKILAMGPLLETYGVTINTECLDKGEYYHIFSSTVLLITAEQYLDLKLAGVELTDPVLAQNPRFQQGDPFIGALEKLEELMEGKVAKQIGTYNAKCEVHMPGQALSMYNDTLLMEDGCTDALQEKLKKGWRIIAACPQPDQRRPDYILGRWNPEEP